MNNFLKRKPLIVKFTIDNHFIVVTSTKQKKPFHCCH